MELNELKTRAYKIACEHGFHEEELSDKHFLMLVITELSEAVEADRKGTNADLLGFESDCAFSTDHMPEAFIEAFETLIKDSVGDELADAAIRLLDLAGLRGIEVTTRELMEESITSEFRDMPFTECIYYIVHNIIAYSTISDHCINITLTSIFALAKSKGIDLLWHIEEKMKYNELRPNKHGKKY